MHKSATSAALSSSQQALAVKRYLNGLHDRITAAVEAVDTAKFRRDPWKRPEGGGGESRVLTEGWSIHEMGTARMGTDPKTSVLNKHNQAHDVKNLFLTDGACMASSSCVNPSLTYMALTARACDYAVSEMKKGEL